jgi:hypothetical protein
MLSLNLTHIYIWTVYGSYSRAHAHAAVTCDHYYRVLLQVSFFSSVPFVFRTVFSRMRSLYGLDMAGGFVADMIAQRRCVVHDNVSNTICFARQSVSDGVHLLRLRGRPLHLAAIPFVSRALRPQGSIAHQAVTIVRRVATCLLGCPSNSSR